MGNKVILTITGIGGTGKSTTIKKVSEKLLRYPFTKKIEEKKLNYDIDLILEIEGIKVGIRSLGDKFADTQQINRFIEKECSIILCATKAYGQTYNEMQNIADRHSEYTLKRIYTNKVDDIFDAIEIEKDGQAEKIVKMIFEIIENSKN